MARTFTAGRTDQDALATEPTLLEVLAALQNIEIDIEQQANPVIVSDNGEIGLAPAGSGQLGTPYTVPVGKKLRVKGITVWGDGDGLFYFDVNGGAYFPWLYSNSWSQKGTTVQIEHVLVAGDTVVIGVDNISTHGNSNGYFGSWWGYLEDM